jgi:hypothetical protein
VRHEPERNDGHHSDATDVGSDSQRAHPGFVLVFDLCEVDAFRVIPIRPQTISMRRRDGRFIGRPALLVVVRPERYVIVRLDGYVSGRLDR